MCPLVIGRLMLTCPPRQGATTTTYTLPDCWLDALWGRAQFRVLNSQDNCVSIEIDLLKVLAMEQPCSRFFYV